MSEPTLLLVDGSSYLYRAFHAMPDLRGPENVPTGAIHGMVAMLRLLRKQYPAEHAACVFDAKGKTFRDDWYADYKAQRAPMPEALAAQIEPIHDVVKLLGWPVLMVPGIEADDAIGTLAKLAARTGHRVVISTGDKDLTQLVNPTRSRWYNTMSNEAARRSRRRKPSSASRQARSSIIWPWSATRWTACPASPSVGPKTAAKMAGPVRLARRNRSPQRRPDRSGVVGQNLREAPRLPAARQEIGHRRDRLRPVWPPARLADNPEGN